MKIKFIRPFRFYKQGDVIDADDGVGDVFVLRGFAERVNGTPPVNPPQVKQDKAKGTTRA